MKFALKETPEGKGLMLCDAQTGEYVPGQISVELMSEPGLSTTSVTLRFFNLPIFKG